MQAISKNVKRWPKWALFATFLLTVPAPYFMIVVGGLVPTAWIIYLAIQGLIVALPKFTAEGFWMLGILWAHVIILAGLLYLFAAGISWLLFRLFSARYATFGVIGLIIALFVSSAFEIYRIPGHNSAPPANLFRLIMGP